MSRKTGNKTPVACNTGVANPFEHKNEPFPMVYEVSVYYIYENWYGDETLPGWGLIYVIWADCPDERREMVTAAFIAEMATLDYPIAAVRWSDSPAYMYDLVNLDIPLEGNHARD